MTDTTNVDQNAQPQPAAAMPPAPGQMPQPGAPQSKQKMILIAIAVVALIAGAIYFTTGGKVSKEDYRKGVDVGNSVIPDASGSIADLNKIMYVSSLNSETSIKNDIDDAKDSLAKYKDANKKLADIAALKDKEVKEKYDAYMSKFKSYTEFTDAYITSAQKVLPALAECNDFNRSYISSDGAKYKAEVTTCKDAIDAVSGVKDKDLSKLLTDYKESLKKVSDLTDEYVAIPTSDYMKMSATRTSITEETRKMRDFISDANSNLTKRSKDVSPRDAFNAFGELMEDKQREK